MTVVQQLAAAAAPWASLYSDHVAVSATVTTVHIVSLLLSGGLAIAADRATLRALRRPAAERDWQLAELGGVHRPVLAALTILILSGVLLAAADVETFATSRLFWVKMALVAALLVNGASLYRIERHLARAPADDPRASKRWRALGRHARASLGLWLTIAIIGTVLTSAA